MTRSARQRKAVENRVQRGMGGGEAVGIDVDGRLQVTDLLAAFQRLDPPQKALAIRLVRSIPS